VNMSIRRRRRTHTRPIEATGQLAARVMEVRAAGNSATEVVGALTAEGTPISAQPRWQSPDAGCFVGSRGAALESRLEPPLDLTCDHPGVHLSASSCRSVTTKTTPT
jgi:hypothetical protein